MVVVSFVKLRYMFIWYVFGYCCGVFVGVLIWIFCFVIGIGLLRLFVMFLGVVCGVICSSDEVGLVVEFFESVNWIGVL